MKNRINWNNLVPPGRNGTLQRNWLLGGLAAAFVCTILFFLSEYGEHKAMLELAEKMYPGGPGQLLPDFEWLVAVPSLSFAVVFGVALPQICYNYIYTRRGSRSDYTLRRLPDKWEWHRRCLAVPVLAVSGGMLLLALALVLCFLIYQFATPPQFLRCNQEGAELWQYGRIYSLLYGIFC